MTNDRSYAKVLTFGLNGAHKNIFIAKFLCIRVFIVFSKVNFGLFIHRKVDKSMTDA
jgi:hypothetical protein